MTTPNTTAGALGVFEWTSEREALLKRTICKGATDDEFALFLGHSKRTGLDPFAGQIHAVKRRNRKENRDEMKMQTGIDGFRLIAQRTGEYEGQVPKQWCGPDGIWTDVWLKPENPKAARAGVWRKGFREPLYAIALWDEYAQTYQDDSGKTQLTKFWANMDAHMLAKCAEALVLRQAFPQEMSDLFLKEELHRRMPDPEPAPAPRRASEPAPPAGTTAAEDGEFKPAFGAEPVQAPGPATGPAPAPAPAPEPTPPGGGESTPPGAGSAQAPAPPPRTKAPAGPIMEFDDSITRTNSKDIGKGRTKYGICTGSGRWINTIDNDAGTRANRLKGTNIQVRFKIVKNDYGFELVEMQEIPPGGLK